MLEVRSKLLRVRRDHWGDGLRSMRLCAPMDPSAVCSSSSADASPPPFGSRILPYSSELLSASGTVDIRC